MCHVNPTYGPNTASYPRVTGGQNLPIWVDCRERRTERTEILAWVTLLSWSCFLLKPIPSVSSGKPPMTHEYVSKWNNHYVYQEQVIMLDNDNTCHFSISLNNFVSRALPFLLWVHWILCQMCWVFLKFSKWPSLGLKLALLVLVTLL